MALLARRPWLLAFSIAAGYITLGLVLAWVLSGCGAAGTTGPATVIADDKAQTAAEAGEKRGVSDARNGLEMTSYSPSSAEQREFETAYQEAYEGYGYGQTAAENGSHSNQPYDPSWCDGMGSAVWIRACKIGYAENYHPAGSSTPRDAGLRATSWVVLQPGKAPSIWPGGGADKHLTKMSVGVSSFDVEADDDIIVGVYLFCPSPDGGGYTWYLQHTSPPLLGVSLDTPCVTMVALLRNPEPRYSDGPFWEPEEILPSISPRNAKYGPAA